MHTDLINIVLFFSLALALDLGYRWLSFGRLESIAIDMSIFSTVYSALEMLRSDSSHPWKIPLIIGILIMAALILSHIYMKRELGDLISDTFDNLQAHLANQQPLLLLANKMRHVVTYSVDVCIYKKKIGKFKRRDNVIQTIKQAGLDPLNILNDDSFLLPKGMRVLMIVLFAAGGIGSLFVPIYYTLVYGR